MGAIIESLENIAIISFLMLLFIFLNYIFITIYLFFWKYKNFPEVKRISVNKKKMAVFEKKSGEGIPILIIGDVGECLFDWYPVLEKIAERHKVITFDRMGYGWSEMPTTERTSENVAKELREMLDKLEVDKVIIVTKGAGAIYTQHFARLNPKMVAGMVFVEPVTLDFRRFENSFDRAALNNLSLGSEYNRIKKMKKLVETKLTKVFAFIIRGIIMKDYKGVPSNIKNEIYTSKIETKKYETMLQEISYAKMDEGSARAVVSGNLLDRPVLIIEPSHVVLKDFLLKKGSNHKEIEKIIKEREFTLSGFVHGKDVAIKYGLRHPKLLHLREKEFVVHELLNFVQHVNLVLAVNKK